MAYIVPCRSIECIDLDCLNSYLVSDISLFPVFVWKVAEGVFCLALLLFYTADIMLTGKLFLYFSSSFLVQGENKTKQIKIKKTYTPTTISTTNTTLINQGYRPSVSVGVQCVFIMV